MAFYIRIYLKYRRHDQIIKMLAYNRDIFRYLNKIILMLGPLLNVHHKSCCQKSMEFGRKKLDSENYLNYLLTL